jgi:hypothetical protein
MADGFEMFQRDFELFAHQQAAELVAIRVIVQSMMVSIFGTHPTGAQLLSDLRANVLATLSVPLPPEAADDICKRELTKSQAEQFFDELCGAFPGLRTTPKFAS